MPQPKKIKADICLRKSICVICCVSPTDVVPSTLSSQILLRFRVIDGRGQRVNNSCVSAPFVNSFSDPEAKVIQSSFKLPFVRELISSDDPRES